MCVVMWSKRAAGGPPFADRARLRPAPSPPPTAGCPPFRDVRERRCYYVDKTEQIRRLVENGKCYFLSRPRRFGKSLLVDTIKELFEGSEAPFAGLDVHGLWDWSVRHPVVRLDLSGSFRTPDESEENLLDQFADIAAAGPST